jgi:NADH dehydrogenase [ubiquinone] 1 alpha subcomplex assembly factor 7
MMPPANGLTPPPNPLPQGEGELERIIKDRIAAAGPISVADYMELALTHPEFGYYMRRDPLGAQGDFTTSPEISQIFGELAGLWLARQWEVMGKPKAALIELGPGRGTLMADALRASKKINGFHDAISVHLVEKSPVLKQKQWHTLAGKHNRIEWHETLDDLPDMPWLLIANEFFDALPIRQFVYQKDAWHERMVGVEDDHLAFVIPAKAGIQLPFPLDSGQRLDNDAIVEHCQPALSITTRIASHLSAQGGAALVIDYGYAQGKGDTLQAMHRHSYHDTLKNPGEADLTAHVDFAALAQAALQAGAKTFGPEPQGRFLMKIGAGVRVQKLCAQADSEQSAALISGLERLASPDKMGDLFKVMAIAAADHPKPEGF